MACEIGGDDAPKTMHFIKEVNFYHSFFTVLHGYQSLVFT